MKNTFLFIFLSVFTAIQGFAQVVTANPAFPVTDQSAVITFDASQGNGGLAGYTGDVYAHTGVITEYSTGPGNWKYVKTDWGVNSPQTKMTRIADDLYTLEITPNIRDYYGVPETEDILQMAFVFRSGVEVGGSFLEGKDVDDLDIFVNVTEPGLGIQFVKPETRPLLLAHGESFDVEVVANEADSILLFIDDVLIKKVGGSSLTENITPADDLSRWVKAIAKNAEASIADSFMYVIRPAVTIETLPQGIRDGINYVDNETVVLSLLAPGKEYAYVVGDFNSWNVGNDYFMKMTPDGERFWLEISGLVTGQEYIFQYFIDGEIRVGDPYADKTSDPWNDKYISEQTYPGLIDYPDGKTNGVATVLQTAQEEYPWVVESFIPAKTTDLVVYELLVRDFTSEHSYEAVIDKLDYLENLGVNAIELMPVNEFEGNSSWGYNPSFYFAPDKYYGPKNELKRLIDECHIRGIAVILDIVLNHSYDQSPLVQLYFDGNKPTADNPWYNVNSNFANPDAQWGNDFNHESVYTQNFVDSVNLYWMSEYHVDGFRFDFTKGFSNTYHSMSDPWGSIYDAARINILKRMMIQIRSTNENAIVILEHLSENSEEENLANFGMLLWGNLNYNYAEASMGYHDNNKSDFSWISYQKRNWNDPHVMGYMESHDEERIMFKNESYGNGSGSYQITDTTTALERIRLVSAFFYTIPGPKMIWQFGELGYDYSIDYNGRLGEKPVRWDYFTDWRRKYNYDFIGALVDLKILDDIFETENYELGVLGVMKWIKLYGNTMNLVVIGNFGVEQDSIAPVFPHTGTWYDYFTDETLDVSDVSMSIPLARGAYRLYTDVELEKPDIGTAVEEPGNVSFKKFQATLFPNPVYEKAKLVIELEEEAPLSIGIVNLLGVELSLVGEKVYAPGKQEININTSQLKPGIYFCTIRSGSVQDSIKFIKR